MRKEVSLNGSTLDGVWRFNGDTYELRFVLNGECVGGCGLSEQFLPVVVAFLIEAMKARGISVAAVEGEREACAKIIEENRFREPGEVADMIRARANLP